MGNPLIGQIVTAVYLAADRMAIRFDLASGATVLARADADCCSHTWIENVEGVEQLVGNRIVAVDDIDMPNLGTPIGGESVAYYGCRLRDRHR